MAAKCEAAIENTDEARTLEMVFGVRGVGGGNHGHWLCYAPSLLCPKPNTSAESLLTNTVPNDITFFSVWNSGWETGDC